MQFFLLRKLTLGCLGMNIIFTREFNQISIEFQIKPTREIFKNFLESYSIAMQCFLTNEIVHRV